MGLVVDFGYADCQIVPISESVPMIGQTDFVSLGAKYLHAELERLIKEHAYLTINNNKLPYAQVDHRPALTEEIIEDIKLRCCFVTTRERSIEFRAEIGSIENLKGRELNDFKFKFLPDCEYNLFDNIILHIPGYLREMALDILFVDNLDSNQTVQHLILNTLIKCPIDLKKQLAENVVLIGGTCMLEGFKSRLVNEVNILLNEPDQLYSTKLAMRRLQFHLPPCLENTVAWLGGAIFGSLEILDTYSIQNSKYKETEKLPDWFTITNKFEKMTQI